MANYSALALVNGQGPRFSNLVPLDRSGWDLAGVYCPHGSRFTSDGRVIAACRTINAFIDKREAIMGLRQIVWKAVISVLPMKVVLSVLPNYIAHQVKDEIRIALRHVFYSQRTRRSNSLNFRAVGLILAVDLTQHLAGLISTFAQAQAFIFGTADVDCLFQIMPYPRSIPNIRLNT